MTEEDKARLSFKRQFLLQNIRDVKQEWYRLDDYREKLRLWFLTVWFGTVALYFQAKIPNLRLYALLALITIFFYSVELFYLRSSIVRLARISVMEEWLMSADDHAILSLQGPLAHVVTDSGTARPTPQWPFILSSAYIGLLYWLLFTASFFIERLLTR